MKWFIQFLGSFAGSAIGAVGVDIVNGNELEFAKYIFICLFTACCWTPFAYFVFGDN